MTSRKPTTPRPVLGRAAGSKQKPGTARMRLDHTTVVRAAADLVNESGWETLSLGTLAQTLGVQTPSLYNHIDGLAGLARDLTLLSTRELGEQMAKAAIGQAGPAALRQIAHVYRQYIKDNPGIYLLSVRSAAFQDPPDAELQAAQSQILEVMLAVTSGLGLSAPDALHTIRGLRSLVHGFATLEGAGGFGLPLDCDESFRRLIEVFIRELWARDPKS